MITQSERSTNTIQMIERRLQEYCVDMGQLDKLTFIPTMSGFNDQLIIHLNDKPSTYVSVILNWWYRHADLAVVEAINGPKSDEGNYITNEYLVIDNGPLIPVEVVDDEAMGTRDALVSNETKYYPSYEDNMDDVITDIKTILNTMIGVVN